MSVTFSVSMPGLVSTLMRIWPISSAVINSLSVLLAIQTVRTMMPTDASMTTALCSRSTSIISRYQFCILATGPYINAFVFSFGL